MQIYDYKITFQEVPDEISLTFFVHGCSLDCQDCFWDKTKETKKLTKNQFKKLLDTYKNKITCIVFLGGEWSLSLLVFLKIAKNKGFKTCLYTGLEKKELIEKHPEIINHLDYLKTGRYIKELGSLESAITNQQLVCLTNNKIIKGRGFING